jgi:aminoglycoside phosphotransferase family enzyme
MNLDAPTGAPLIMAPPDSNEPVSDQARLIASLRAPTLYDSDCAVVTLIETHISYVLLTGKFAYKIKKDVDLGFLNFTSLGSRRYDCERELALNRRLAPALYLEVVAITGTIDAPALGGGGPVLEYAVKMREFSQDALASRLLSCNELGAADIDVLAAKVATFHASIEAATPDSPHGRPDDIRAMALQNFAQVRALLTAPAGGRGARRTGAMDTA